MSDETPKRERRTLTERDRLDDRLKAAQSKRERVQDQLDKRCQGIGELKARIESADRDIAALENALKSYDQAIEG